MSQQPPTGPGGTPGSSDDDVPPSAGTPEGAGTEPTQSFERSPYDVPESETAAYPAPTYGQAPDPALASFGETSTTEPEPEPEGRRRWVLPVVIAVVVLLVAGGVTAVLLLGGDEEDEGPGAAPSPSVTETETAEPTEEPTEEQPTEPTEEPTEPTEEPTEEQPTEPTEEPTSELLGDLDQAVTVGDLTFELSEDGFVPEEVEGAIEAVRGTYVSGEEQIDMLATLWPDNDTADEYAAQLVEGVEGEQVETGNTYTNETGTFWAFLLEDGRGSYVWTTDRGHVLQVTGSTDHVGGFYAAFPL